MLSQMYLESSKKKNILYVINSMNEKQAKGIVLLIPGFSQSKSDVDYFMTKLANRLFLNGYITVQVDLYAHGDSYGSLEEFTWNDFVKNAEDINRYLTKKYKNLYQYMVTRGVYGNIAMNTELKNMFGLICLNPVNDVKQIKNIFAIEDGEVEINKLLAEKEEYSQLFEVMGSEITNLRGQAISWSLLSTLSDYSMISLEDTVWSYDSALTSLKEQAKCNFIRDPVWQESLIDKLVERLEEMHSSNV